MSWNGHRVECMSVTFLHLELSSYLISGDLKSGMHWWIFLQKPSRRSAECVTSAKRRATTSLMPLKWMQECPQLVCSPTEASESLLSTSNEGLGWEHPASDYPVKGCKGFQMKVLRKAPHIEVPSEGFQGERFQAGGSKKQLEGKASSILQQKSTVKRNQVTFQRFQGHKVPSIECVFFL